MRTVAVLIGIFCFLLLLLNNCYEAVKLHDNVEGRHHKLNSGTTWSCFFEIEPKSREEAEQVAGEWLRTLKEKTGYGSFLRVIKVTKTMVVIHLSGLDKDGKVVSEVLQTLPNLRFAEMDAMTHPTTRGVTNQPL
eukprot:TRINITY_DN16686_c0_g1_i1.p1 TRINITY_DN16686_c0_g1~~TRINITY_DN16686_c0_g1_i1.p1  ORF type:complete len:135 (+),score=10.12 TRINITY_DN16686_c0_g1_i1:155-559(+)